MTKHAQLKAPSSSSRLRAVLIFTAAYMIAAGVSAFFGGNKEFVFYIVVMLVLIGAIALLDRKVKLTSGLLWALSIWGLLHMAGGLVKLPAGLPYHGDHAVLYSLWLIPDLLKYDQVVHAYGFGVATTVCWHALKTRYLSDTGKAVPPTFGSLFLCAAAGCGLGALNEVIEFIAVLTIPNTNVGGYENTGWDLVANMVGSTLAAVLIRLRHGKL